MRRILITIDQSYYYPVSTEDLKSFIEERKIISSSQCGFRQGHSTEHAILDIVNAIQ